MNNCKNAILFTSGDLETIVKIKKIADKLNLNLIIENSLCSVIKKLISIKPNFIFIDEKINNIKNFPFMLLENNNFDHETKLIFLSDSIQFENKYVDVVRIDKLCEYVINSPYYYLSTKNKEIDKNKINNFLLKAGFLPSYKGKDYLKECLALVLEDNVSFNSLNKDCYPQLAFLFKTCINNVDRDIRTAIKKAYENRDKNYWKQCFNIDFDKKPTSRNFIYLCVDKLKETTE